jgi:hypothetical protein
LDGMGEVSCLTTTMACYQVERNIRERQNEWMDEVAVYIALQRRIGPDRSITSIQQQLHLDRPDDEIR